MLTRIIAACTVLCTGTLAKATRESNDLDYTRSLSNDATICNLAWSNSRGQMNTDCDGYDVIFTSSFNIKDTQVSAALGNIQAALDAGKQPDVEVMCYLSVGTLYPGKPIIGRQELAALAWKAMKTVTKTVAPGVMIGIIQMSL